MAGERELESAAKTGAVNANRDRLGKAGQTVQHVLPVGRESLGFSGRAEREELLDIGAGDEVFSLAGEERHGFHARIAGQRREASEEFILHGARDDVDGLAFEIEHDGRDTIRDAPSDGRRGPGGRGDRRHQRRSSTMANPMPPCAHTEIKPNCTSRRRISLDSVITIRPPVAPNG